ncbi:MAG: pyridoxamine 5'-phosphate oxidase family protein [Steroidobacteraceae bacterium]|jgi:general stress protein 26|nr:pyridoxamine 5'-phosphate oxidase family protein [Steroidobacteraceae bacterium]
MDDPDDDHDHDHDPTAEAMAELWQRIRGIRVAMLATVQPGGLLRSRPMATQECEPDGVLWFAADADSAKVAALRADPRVELSWADAAEDLFVTASGTARVVHDPDKAAGIWNSHLNAWWPAGPNDPKLRLIEVTLEAAEYWHARAPRAIQVARLARAAARGERPRRLGEDVKLQVRDAARPGA